MKRAAAGPKALRHLSKELGTTIESSDVLDLSKAFDCDAPEWSALTGLDPEVQTALEAHSAMEAVLSRAAGMHSRDSASGKVVFVCKQGKHGSVAAAELFAQRHRTSVVHVSLVQHLYLQGVRLECGQRSVQNDYASA